MVHIKCDGSGVSNYNVSNKLIYECKGKLVILLTIWKSSRRVGQIIVAAQQVTKVRVLNRSQRSEYKRLSKQTSFPISYCDGINCHLCTYVRMYVRIYMQTKRVKQ